MPARSADEPRISDRVAGHLITYIRQHHLQPGDSLPSEVQIGAELGVSRGIIREAYRSLHMAGILVTANGRAPRVGRIDHQTFVHIFEHALATQQVSPREVLEIRAPIEIRAAELAAVKRTEHDAEQLRVHAGALRRAGNRLDALIAADVAFHEVIGRATGNLLFGVVAGALHGSLVMSMRAGLGGRTRASLARVADIHDTIARAIAEGDAIGARQGMIRHFDDARTGLTDPVSDVIAARPPQVRTRSKGPK